MPRPYECMTAEEAFEKGLTPLNVYDASGTLIRRRITYFEEETGYVKSLILAWQSTGRLHYQYSGGGFTLERKEWYPAPLRFLPNVKPDMVPTDEQLLDAEECWTDFQI